MTNLLEVEAAAGLAVYGARGIPGAADVRARLVADGVPARLAAHDPALWGPAAEAAARTRLGWLDTLQRSRELLPRLAELRDELLRFGVDRVLLAGAGGSALAAQAIGRTLDVRLTVLDSTDPGRVRAAFADRPERTVVVVSGSARAAVEADSYLRYAREVVTDPGRIVVVTEAGSPLERLADEVGAQLFVAAPGLGARHDALSAYGITAAALAGVDVAELLDQAEEFASSLDTDGDNPGLTLGAAIAAAALAGRDKLAVVDDGTGIVGLGDWIEQLVGDATGTAGRGVLPIAVASPDSPGLHRDDVLIVTTGGALPPASVPGAGIPPHASVNGPLGAQFLAWEYAAAVAARVLEVDPFDESGAASLEQETTRLLDGGTPAGAPAFTDGPVEVYASDTGGATSLSDLLGWLLSRVPPGGYLAVTAFLDPAADAAVAGVRSALADHTSAAVTFGWGPRYLHGAGRHDRSGPATGAYLQITGAVAADLPVPGRPFTFGRLAAAQAAAGREAPSGRGRPLVRLHLTDRTAGVARLLAAVDDLPWVS